MPMFEFKCPSCERFSESYLHRWDDPNPLCVCGAQQIRRVSTFSAPFSGSIQKYTDLSRENSHMDGFWSYRKVSSVSGQPEPVYISTMSELAAFNKAEGLAAPGEVPTNATITADGRQITSNGMPGNWNTGMPAIPARLQEMISVKAEDCVSPTTCTPAMPPGHGVSVERVDANDPRVMSQFEQTAGQAG